MINPKDQLREDSIDFAIEVADICDEIYVRIKRQCGSIRRRLIASITTVKGKTE